MKMNAPLHFYLVPINHQKLFEHSTNEDDSLFIHLFEFFLSFFVVI